ncbi:MAG TPA: YkgJ family cysteine cluster protein [Syntrophales bacterium]|nr:YkgJ family cysteine cluster protein [Syntrophales bacterium]
MTDIPHIPCLRCGICCMADMIADADEEDLERWKRDDRNDILQVYRDARWVGDHFVSVATGMTIHDCPFLDYRDGFFACTIYETRPRVCRDFEPGSSEICSQFQKGPSN